MSTEVTALGLLHEQLQLLADVPLERIYGSTPAAADEVEQQRELWHAQMKELVRLRRFFLDVAATEGLGGDLQCEAISYLLREMEVERGERL